MPRAGRVLRMEDPGVCCCMRYREFLYLVLGWVGKMECWCLSGEGLMDYVFWCSAGEHLEDVGDYCILYYVGPTSV